VLGLAETINSAGLVAWLFKNELIAKVADEIKQAARDSEALDRARLVALDAALLEQMMDCEWSDRCPSKGTVMWLKTAIQRI
jgi:hypothetical protein